MDSEELGLVVTDTPEVSRADCGVVGVHSFRILPLIDIDDFDVLLSLFTCD
jgi:hypothetical protein